MGQCLRTDHFVNEFATAGQLVNTTAGPLV